jgi:hypothetical protein
MMNLRGRNINILKNIKVSCVNGANYFIVFINLYYLHF